jgi:hypothetical protein
MSITPGSNKPSNTKTTTPVKSQNAQKENRNEFANKDKGSKDEPKSDMKSDKSQKGRS